jgi:hypothetical protein
MRADRFSEAALATLANRTLTGAEFTPAARKLAALCAQHDTIARFSTLVGDLCGMTRNGLPIQRHKAGLESAGENPCGA